MVSARARTGSASPDSVNPETVIGRIRVVYRIVALVSGPQVLVDSCALPPLTACSANE